MSYMYGLDIQGNFASSFGCFFLNGCPMPLFLRPMFWKELQLQMPLVDVSNTVKDRLGSFHVGSYVYAQPY